MKDASSVNGNASLGDLGLDSLMGVEVKQTLERDYELVLPMKDIRALTMNKLSDIAAGGGASSSDSPKETKSGENSGEKSTTKAGSSRFDPASLMPHDILVRMNEGKEGVTPLFVVHSIEGAVISLQTVMSQVEGPVYGLQCTKQVPVVSVEEVAKYYLQVCTF